MQAVQRRNFYQLHCTIRTRGNYCHEYSMAIEVERDSPTWQPMTDGAEDAVIEAMRDLARWLYRQLEREYDYLTSDDAVDEAIAINQWSFTAQESVSAEAAAHPRHAGLGKPAAHTPPIAPRRARTAGRPGAATA